MPLTDLLTAQLTDLFRIGLIAALIITAHRTSAATGWWLPLACGVAFVAVIIPTTMQTQSPVPLWQLICTGLVANLIILAAGLGIYSAYKRWRG